MNSSKVSFIPMNRSNPILKNEYKIEFIGSHSCDIQGLIKRITTNDFTKQHIVPNEGILVDKVRNDITFHFRLILNCKREIDVTDKVDARVHVPLRDSLTLNNVDFNSCNIQIACGTENDDPKLAESINDMDVLFVSLTDGTGIDDLTDTLADRIYQSEYIHNKYLAKEIINMNMNMNMAVETFTHLYPCMLIDYKLNTIILPNSLKIIHPNAFFGLKNEFSLFLKGSSVTEIGKNNFCSQPIIFIDFPATLEKLGSFNFNNCKNIKGVIDLSQTQIKILDECFNDMKVPKIEFPATLVEVTKSCFQNFQCKELDFTNTNLQRIHKSFDDFKGEVKLDKNKLVKVPVTYIPKFNNKGTIDLYNTKIEEITNDEIFGKNGYPVAVTNAIKLPKELKECSTNIFEIPNNKIVFDFTNTQLTRLLQSNPPSFGYRGVSSIIFPPTLKYLSISCFEQCTLENFDLSKTQIEDLPDRAFASSKITSIKLPSSLKSIGSECFSNCQSLKYIDIPSQTENIGKDAFNSTLIKFLVIPENVKSYSHTIEDNYRLKIIVTSQDNFNFEINGEASNVVVYCTNTKKTLFSKAKNDENSPKVISGVTIIEPDQQNNGYNNFDYNSLEKVGKIKTWRTIKMKDTMNLEYAVKRFENQDDFIDKAYMSELDKLKALSHPTILPPAGYIDLPNKNYFCICTKFCSEGTLANKMKNKLMTDDAADDDDDSSLTCIIDIILAMTQINEEKIIHRNIKPSNIFIDGEYFKVGDFGLAGSFGFMAPDILYRLP